MHHFLPFLLGYDILMDHFFTSGWFHHFHITTFFLAHFQVIFFKKAHPYLTKKKVTQSPIKSNGFAFCEPWLPPQRLQLGGFQRLQATMSRLFRGCQGLRMVGGDCGFRCGFRGSVDQLCLGKCCENMTISWKISLSLLGTGIESSSLKSWIIGI